MRLNYKWDTAGQYIKSYIIILNKEGSTSTNKNYRQFRTAYPPKNVATHRVVYQIGENDYPNM